MGEQKIEPALSDRFRAVDQDGKIVAVDRDGNVVAESANGVEWTPRSFSACTIAGIEFPHAEVFANLMDRDDLRPEHRERLPGWIRTLRNAADRIEVSDGLPGETDGDSTSLRAIADALESYLPPEP